MTARRLKWAAEITHERFGWWIRYHQIPDGEHRLILEMRPRTWTLTHRGAVRKATRKLARLNRPEPPTETVR